MIIPLKEQQKEIVRTIFNKLELTKHTPEQKRKCKSGIYIMQAGGLRLGYGFGLGKAAPYSTALAYDFYDLTHPLGPSLFHLSSKDEDRFNEIKEKFISPFNLDELELLASSHYIFNRDHREDCTLFQGFKKHFLNYRPKAMQTLTDSDLKGAWVEAANLIAYREFHDKKD